MLNSKFGPSDKLEANKQKFMNNHFNKQRNGNNTGKQSHRSLCDSSTTHRMEDCPKLFEIVMRDRPRKTIVCSQCHTNKSLVLFDCGCKKKSQNSEIQFATIANTEPKMCQKCPEVYKEDKNVDIITGDDDYEPSQIPNCVHGVTLNDCNSPQCLDEFVVWYNLNIKQVTVDVKDGPSVKEKSNIHIADSSMSKMPDRANTTKFNPIGTSIDASVALLTTLNEFEMYVLTFDEDIELQKVDRKPNENSEHEHEINALTTNESENSESNSVISASSANTEQQHLEKWEMLNTITDIMIQTVNWHKQTFELIPKDGIAFQNMIIAKKAGFKIVQAFIDQNDLTLEQQQFLAYFNDSAPYHKAVRDLTLATYEDCGWCNKPHLREEHTLSYCADPSDGVFEDGNSGAPCLRGVQTWDNMFWKDYLRTYKPFRHEKLAIVFPTFVIDQVGMNQCTKACPNAIRWNDFKQSNWQSQYYDVLFAIRYNVKA